MIADSMVLCHLLFTIVISKVFYISIKIVIVSSSTESFQTIWAAPEYADIQNVNIKFQCIDQELHILPTINISWLSICLMNLRDIDLKQQMITYLLIEAPGIFISQLFFFCEFYFISNYFEKAHPSSSVWQIL